MPAASQVFATDRKGLIYILNPSTLAPASGWVQNLVKPFPGPALFGLGLDASTYTLFVTGLPDGTASNFFAFQPLLAFGSTYSLEPTAYPAQMPARTFQPDAVAVDSSHKKLFVADRRKMLTAWNTDLVASGGVYGQLTGSPYYPKAGPIEAQGVAYNASANRVYTCCQDANGQDYLAVFNAATNPMTQISGSPFPLTLALSTSQTAIAYDSTNSRILISSSLGLIALNATTFAPIAGSPFSTGGLNPGAIALDSTRVYVCNFGSDNFAALSRSTLAPISGSPYATGHGPKAIAYYSSTNRVYVANFNGNPGGISVYNAAATPLTQISGSPFLSGIPFSSVVVGP